MSIRSKLIVFSSALLALPAALIVVLIRIFYYRVKADAGTGADDASVWKILIQNYGTLFGILLLLVVVVLIVSGIVFMRSILQPLNKLQEAAKEIEKGNLDVEIQYKGQDEFQPVFEQFEAMRTHLKDLIWQRMQSERDRVDMVANIAHDFKTPITAIQGYAQGLLDGVASTPEKEAHYLQTIVTKSGDLTKMADRLYDFSKLELQTMRFDMMEVPVQLTLEEIFADAMLFESNLIVTTDFSELPKDATIQIDPTLFRRVLSNVWQNSVKYKDSAEATVHVQAYAQNNRVFLCLEDDGIGLREEECDKIFERFYRSDAARTGPENGSGLGLSIAKQMVEEMGGKIWARPGKEKGLRIYMSFPLLQ